MKTSLITLLCAALGCALSSCGRFSSKNSDQPTVEARPTPGNDASVVATPPVGNDVATGTETSTASSTSTSTSTATSTDRSTSTGPQAPGQPDTRTSRPQERDRFPKLRKAFPEVGLILKSENTAETLAKLRTVATPTFEYHEELLTLVEQASSIDVAHLKMLLLAVHTPFETYQKLMEERRALNDKNDEASNRKRYELALKIQESSTSALYSANIANEAMQKIVSLQFDEARDVLSMLYPTGVAHIAFFFSLRKMGDTSETQKRELRKIALEKLEYMFAADITAKLYKHHSDLSFEALESLLKEVEEPVRSYALQKTVDHFESLTHQQAMILVELSEVDNGGVALKVYGLSSERNHANFVALASKMKEERAQYFVTKGLRFYATVSSEELQDLCKLTRYGCQSIVMEAAQKWANPSVKGAVAVAGIVDYDAKDRWLLAASNYLQSVTAEEVIEILKAASNKEFELATKLLSKLDVIAISNVVRIASFFESDERDRWLLFTLRYFQTVLATELQSLLRASYRKQLQISIQLVRNVTDLTVANAVGVANILQYEDKDVFLSLAVDLVFDLSDKNLATLVESAYLKKDEIRRKGLARIM